MVKHLTTFDPTRINGSESLQSLGRSGDIEYLKLEDASEIDRFHIVGVEEGDLAGGGFEFFRGLGIIGYRNTFKMWLRKFPRPVFIVAVKNRNIVSWVFIEEWDSSAKDGSAVWVLRAIETIVPLRKHRVGYRLMMLGAKHSVGYLITKPLTPEASRFFKRAGFMELEEFRKVPIDLSRNPGYVILPPFQKIKLMNGMERYFSPHKMGEEDVKDIL